MRTLQWPVREDREFQLLSSVINTSIVQCHFWDSVKMQKEKKETISVIKNSKWGWRKTIIHKQNDFKHFNCADWEDFFQTPVNCTVKNRLSKLYLTSIVFLGQAIVRMGETRHEWDGEKKTVLQHFLPHGRSHMCGLESLCSHW